MTDTSQKASKMEKLLQKEDQPILPKVGDLIKAKVIYISRGAVYLDIDGIATGVVRGKEIIDESGEFSDVKSGDKVQATVLELENENGEIELSFRAAGHQKAWNNLQKMMEKEEIIDTSITDANRGGLMVKVGKIEGFMPVSQLIPEHYPRVEGGDKNKILNKLKEFVGQKIKAKIIDVDESESKLILSEKAAWKKERKKVISKYNVGDIIEGKITGVVDFGIFIEFGDGLEGLIHISELAWQRIENPRNKFEVSDKIKAKIISIEDTKISLSIKKLEEDPWKEVVEKYKVGDIVKGKVLKINPFGAFIELDKDIHGLVHISELSEKKINHPSEVVKENEEYKLKILSIEPENHRLGLSLKAAGDKPKKKNQKKKKVSKKEEEKKEEKTESKRKKDEKKSTKSKSSSRTKKEKSKKIK
ncbi:MAG: S1 RNA-binding domain-containing protein [Patescibacteria group bacterium]|nr:S1 RNA-binding domain-containing protein [Patescibacteria group bacterium]